MIPLVPLIALAAGLVPKLIGLLGTKRAGDVAGDVAAAVQTVTGTTDPAVAAQKLQADPATETTLRAKLEDIEQRYAKLQNEDAQAERQAMLDTLRAEIDDRKRASNTMIDALGIGDWSGRAIALTPAIVSAIVLIGFFAFTAWIVHHPPTGDITLLNVVIGALVAGFTAVLNFWLGSSQGSRDKDKTVVALQQAQAAQATETVRQVREAATASSSAAQAPLPAATPKAAGPIPGVPSRFELCLDIVRAKEGGYSDNSKDPGGPTMMGITQSTLSAWRGHPVSAEEVQALTGEEACEIYRSNYWNTLRCNDLPQGVDLMAFNFGVNAGPSRSAKLLQRAAGAEPDGAVGDLTLRAVHASDPRRLIEAMAASQLQYYHDLNSPDFGKGWENRLADIRKQALLMAPQ